MSTKNRHIEAHARQRFKERFNLKFNDNIEQKIKSMIYNGDASLIEKQTNTKSILQIKFPIQSNDLYDRHDNRYKVGDTILINFVWDKNKKQIVTFLFPEKPKIF